MKMEIETGSENKWKPLSREEFRAQYHEQQLEDVLHGLHVEFVQCANQMWKTQKTVREVIESQNELNKQHSETVQLIVKDLNAMKNCVAAFENYIELPDTPIGYQKRLTALEKREGVLIAVVFILGLIFGSGMIK